MDLTRANPPASVPCCVVVASLLGSCPVAAEEEDVRAKTGCSGLGAAAGSGCSSGEVTRPAGMMEKVAGPSAGEAGQEALVCAAAVGVEEETGVGGRGPSGEAAAAGTPPPPPSRLVGNRAERVGDPGGEGRGDRHIEAKEAAEEEEVSRRRPPSSPLLVIAPPLLPPVAAEGPCAPAVPSSRRTLAKTGAMPRSAGESGMALGLVSGEAAGKRAGWPPGEVRKGPSSAPAPPDGEGRAGLTGGSPARRDAPGRKKAGLSAPAEGAVEGADP